MGHRDDISRKVAFALCQGDSLYLLDFLEAAASFQARMEANGVASYIYTDFKEQLEFLDRNLRDLDEGDCDDFAEGDCGDLDDGHGGDLAEANDPDDGDGGDLGDGDSNVEQHLLGNGGDGDRGDLDKLEVLDGKVLEFGSSSKVSKVLLPVAKFDNSKSQVLEISSNIRNRKGSRREVVKGKSLTTTGGLDRTKLVRSSNGRKFVAKKASETASARVPGTAFDLWRRAREFVREKHGFAMVCCGGRTKDGERFLALMRQTYNDLKSKAALLD